MPDTDALHRGDFMEPRYTLVKQAARQDGVERRIA